ncbi:MAG: LysR family transcriptional regulator [Gammaproteobacteria bacterium]
MFLGSLQQLRLFEAVARNQSYTRAAEEIHLSQPAVSIQVKRLEEQIGMPLFEKIGKGIFLTAAGQELYDACSDMFDRMERLKTRLYDLQGEIAGPLKIGVVTTAKYILPHLLGEFLQRYPKVEPHLKVSNRERIMERFDENNDDIYILGHADENRQCEDHPFLDDELVIFASPKHPLAGRNCISLQTLATERFLFREEGSGIRTTFENFLASHDLSMTPYMELGSGEAIKQAVMANLGIGMLSLFSLSLELEANRLVVLDVVDLPIKRKWRVVYPKGKQLSPVAHQFIDFVKETGKDFKP